VKRFKVDVSLRRNSSGKGSHSGEQKEEKEEGGGRIGKKLKNERKKELENAEGGNRIST